jgi:hypothetical protein
MKRGAMRRWWNVLQAVRPKTRRALASARAWTADVAWRLGCRVGGWACALALDFSAV